MLDCCQNALKTWNLTGQRDPVIGHFQVTTKPKLIRVLLGILVGYFGDFNVYMRQHRFILFYLIFFSCSCFSMSQIFDETKGGFPIKIETEISLRLLISNSFAVLIV